jgi:NADH-quinone oxidoreductase subunit G
LARHEGAAGALVGGQATNEEGFLIQRLWREALQCSDIDSRVGEAVDPDLARALAAPALQATVPDIEFAHTVLVLGCEPLDDAPILDLRIRKGVRRRGVRLAVATARPSALDPNAGLILRYPPGGEAAFLAGLDRALEGGAANAQPPFAELAHYLREGGEDVVILWGERRLNAEAIASLLGIARRLDLAEHDGAGLLEIPAGANGRGLREAGVLPGSGPGYGELSGVVESRRGAREIAQAAAGGEITALYLFQTDPLRDLPDRALWERALQRAALVVAHASVLTEGLAEHANVIFPAESHAEKEGTVVHPDGRLQRLRTAIAHPGAVRSGWSVIAEIARRAGLDTGVLTSSMVFEQLVEAVPFYGGLTLDEIGGRGIRWQERDAASAFPTGADAVSAARPSQAAPEDGASNGGLRLGTYRSIWAAPEVEISPALKFTLAHQQVELAPEDAQRLGIAPGEAIAVSQNGTSVDAIAHVRTDVPAGTVFLAEGIPGASANAFTEPVVEVHKR